MKERGRQSVELIEAFEAMRAECARAKFMCLACMGLIAWLLLCAQREADPIVVKARRFVLEDGKGLDRAEWFEQDGNVRLSFKSTTGQQIAALWVESDGSASLHLSGGKNGEGRAHIAVDAQGAPLLRLNRGGELGGVDLSVDTLGTSRLNLQGKNGKPAITARISDTGQPEVALYDEEGRVRSSLALKERGEPTFTCRDSRGIVLFAAP